MIGGGVLDSPAAAETAVPSTAAASVQPAEVVQRPSERHAVAQREVPSPPALDARARTAHELVDRLRVAARLDRRLGPRDGHLARGARGRAAVALERDAAPRRAARPSHVIAASEGFVFPSSTWLTYSLREALAAELGLGEARGDAQRPHPRADPVGGLPDAGAARGARLSWCVPSISE